MHNKPSIKFKISFIANCSQQSSENLYLVYRNTSDCFYMLDFERQKPKLKKNVFK